MTRLASATWSPRGETEAPTQGSWLSPRPHFCCLQCEPGPVAKASPASGAVASGSGRQIGLPGPQPGSTWECCPPGEPPVGGA